MCHFRFVCARQRRKSARRSAPSTSVNARTRSPKSASRPKRNAKRWWRNVAPSRAAVAEGAVVAPVRAVGVEGAGGVRGVEVGAGGQDDDRW